MLADFASEADFYGVLRPREKAELAMKAVDRETALLYLTLSQPGFLPNYVRSPAGVGRARAVAQLVAEGILEVESDGAFVGGTAAVALVAGWAQRDADEGARRGGRLADLSRTALRLVQDLELDDPNELAFRLYAYNRRPLTPEWQRLLPNAEATLRYLGIASGGPHRAILDRDWFPHEVAKGWLSWGSLCPDQTRQSAPTRSRDRKTYKLYVSPAPEFLSAGFDLILTALAQAPTFQFKVGCDAAGLLRPDKIVAYFTSFESLAEAARGLTQYLGGVPAHGVPFTSEIAGRGLLSWGVDPPAAEQVPPWGRRESWRMWLANRLARALLAARVSASVGAKHTAAPGIPKAEPWQVALERLQIDGVDTDSWTPDALLWSGR
jgi:hypothetical protein